jgi:hypothetical protein
MAQTKRKRQTKHRGNAAGSITTRGRTGRPPSPQERKKQNKEEARIARLNRRPTWKMMIQRAALTSVVMFAVLLFATKGKGILYAIALAAAAFALYVPLGYYLELWMWKRRMAKQGKPAI